MEADSHIEDVGFLRRLNWLNWLRLWLSLRHVDDIIEDIIIINDAPFRLLHDNWFGLLSWLLSRLFSWLLLWLSPAFLLMCMASSILRDVLIIIDHAGSWHPQRADINIHISLSHWYVFEGFDSGFERRNRDANFLFSVNVPNIFE